MKKYFLAFVLAFLLNFIWENLHSVFYLNYQGGAITQFVLLRASFIDALIILALIFLFRFILFLKNQPWLLFIFGIIIAIVIEQWALSVNRWSYTETMPLVPILNTGLTPTIQLGLLAYFVYKIIFKSR